jgi:hypothetical protein
MRPPCARCSKSSPTVWCDSRPSGYTLPVSLASDASWPPPHPSPPLPPPREYGAPGTPPGRQPWLVGLLAAVAVAALLGAVLLVRSLLSDDPGEERSDPAPTGSSSPTQEPTPTPTAAAAPAVRCWDGTSVEQVAQCSRPDGATGMAWVFPNLAGQKCGSPTQTGPGVVLRILCVDRLADGTRVQVGYYQWQSVRAGTAFYEGQGLSRADANGLSQWTGGSGETAKVAVMYAQAPFSLTVTLPVAAQGAPDAPGLVALRPPDQLRGEPTP